MKFNILILLLCFFSLPIYPQQVIDRIVAVVDNEVILQSELEFQTSIFAAQRQIDPGYSGIKRPDT
jgi:peptidyl-prolyl cis-trans isomerase SurA